MINLTTFIVEDCPTFEEGLKYLRTLYQTNIDRFKARFLEPTAVWLKMNGIKRSDEIIDFYLNQYIKTTPYTYEEAFKIKSNEFRAKVFTSINVPEMIKNLGATRIKTEGIDLINQVYQPLNNSFKEEALTQVYELHEVDLTKLNIDDKVYAIKCWCTSTNEEHWLFIDSLKDPLEAIANTCVIYKKMLNKIKHIIRQGDVFLFEMLEEVEIYENDETMCLSKDIYFKLLKSQS